MEMVAISVMWYLSTQAEQLTPAKNCDLNWLTRVSLSVKISLNISVTMNLISISLEVRRGKISAQDQVLFNLEQCDNSQ